MRFLLSAEPSADLDRLLGTGQAAHATGLDGIFLRTGPGLSAPLVAAAALGPALPGLLIAAEVTIGDRHPIEVAEEAITVDHVCGGRLILVCTPEPGTERDFAEALDLIRRAATPAPFAVDGPRWPVPARLPNNVHGMEDRVRVSPAPAAARLEVWASGAGVAAALDRALGVIHEADAHPAAAHATAERRLGSAQLGAPRARRDVLDDPEALIERLLAGRESFGQDWAVVATPTERAAELGAFVRPRMQLDALPDGLLQLWRTHRDELWPPDLDMTP